MKLRSFLLVLSLGTTFAAQACAYESLIGEYTGKLESVEGYTGNAGDPCTVTVAASNMYGGSVSFEIRNMEKLFIEVRAVQNALSQATGVVKIHSPGGTGKPAEIVVMKVGSDGALSSLKLMRRWGGQHQQKSAACSGLSRN